MNAILRSIAIVVGLPTLIAAIYFGAIASDIYVSEARFAVRSAKSSGGGGLAAILASPIAGGGSQDTMVVADYVHSRDMLRKVAERIDIVEHYSDPDIDPLARLDPDADGEELLEYFAERVRLLHDTQSDVVTLTVSAFDPEFAQRLAALVIELGEGLVNDLSTRIEEDALSTARSEVERAEEIVTAASSALTRFRNSNTLLDPTAESAARLNMVAQVESRLIEARSMLGEKEAFMQPDAPEVVALKNRVKALERQLGLERGRLVAGTDGGQGNDLSGLIESYQPLQLEQELALRRYTSALGSLEGARLEAQRKKQYLITFIEPNLPDAALEPRRLYEVLTVMVFAFLIHLVGGLMWSALRDHIGK